MVLFFNGFCMDEKDININNVKYINGIVTEKELEELHTKYSEVVTTVIGYSFGCYYANLFINKFDDISHINTIAICGTPNVIDRKKGINPLLINNMLRSMSSDVMDDFYNKIGYKKDYNLTIATNELSYIINNYIEMDNKFKVAILSSEDNIFALKKLSPQYENKYIINAKHYVFNSEEFSNVYSKVLKNPK